MEEDEKIELSAEQFLKAMHEGVATDINKQVHDFRSGDDHYINSVVVKQKIHCQQTTYSSYITLGDCEFTDKVTFSRCDFINGIDITRTQFDKDVSLFDSTFGSTILFDECTFDNNLRFHRNKVQSDFLLLESAIMQGLSFSRNEIANSVHLHSSKYIGHIQFKEDVIQNDLRFGSLLIEKQLHLLSVAIKGNLRILLTNAQEINPNVQLEPGKSSEISASGFDILILPEFIPEKSSFKIVTTNFKTIVSPQGFTNLGYMQWNNLHPRVDAYLKIDNAVMGRWDIVNCNFENIAMEIYSSKITDAFYTNSTFPKVLSVPIHIVDKTVGHNILRDGYNQLKTLAQKQNDRKTFLHYQAAEMRSYNDTIQFKENRATKIQLYFMQLSNDFGTNWVRAVVFTGGLNLFFLIIALAGRPFDICKTPRFLGQYFNFLLSLTSKPDFIKDDKEVFAFYFSRIFIAFGIYQTISAFRKFGKGES